jgi:hypothetical protein
VRRSFAARFRTHRDTALEIASDSTHFGMFLLSKPSPLRLWAIVDEAALHRQIGGPDVMRAQLVHLIKAASEPPVTLQVIPYSAGAHAGRPGSFALLDFPNPADPAVVHIDTWQVTCSWKARPTYGGTACCLNTSGRPRTPPDPRSPSLPPGGPRLLLGYVPESSPEAGSARATGVWWWTLVHRDPDGTVRWIGAIRGLRLASFRTLILSLRSKV